MSGYFHILSKEKFQDGHSVPLTDPKILTQQSLG